MFFNKFNKVFSKPKNAAYMFLFPSMIVVVVFVLLPVIVAVMLSFFKLDIFLSELKFVGFSNFQRMIGDERFWNALGNTFKYVSAEVPIQILLGLIVAICLKHNTFFNKVSRTIFFIPVVVSMSAVGILWSLILDQTLGIYPYWLTLIGLPKYLFLRDPNMAMGTVIGASVWKNFGFTMVIMIAGLNAIPDVYYEAAMIDGANGIKKFFYITVPMLMPTLGFVAVTTTITSFQVFDAVYVMTQGGPLFKTETIVQYIYSRGFSVTYELGYASTIALVLFIIIAIISILMYNFFIKKETVNL